MQSGERREDKNTEKRKTIKEFFYLGFSNCAEEIREKEIGETEKEGEENI